MRIARCWMLVAAVTLSGCGVQNLWRDETERFEEAQPLPAAIRGRVRAILLGGYHTSMVTGAYEANSAGYTALDNEVMRQTGQRIGGFQGRYGGKTFMVGGR